MSPNKTLAPKKLLRQKKKFVQERFGAQKKFRSLCHKVFSLWPQLDFLYAPLLQILIGFSLLFLTFCQAQFQLQFQSNSIELR